MTGPLAQQFAQVRSDIAECCHDCDDGCQRDKTVAALSAIERHVQDMENALRAPVGFIEALALGQYAASEPTLRAARIYAPQARAALPAREKGEETNG